MVWDSIINAGASLYGHNQEKKAAKRQQQYTRQNMDYQQQLKQKDATWMRDELYDKKLTPWELSGQSGFSASGGAGAPAGASLGANASSSLTGMAANASNQLVNKQQIDSQQEITDKNNYAAILSNTAGDPVASKHALEMYKHNTGKDSFWSSTGKPTLQERQTSVAEETLRLNQARLHFDKTGNLGSIGNLLRPILGNDLIEDLTTGDKSVVEGVTELLAKELEGGSATIEAAAEAIKTELRDLILKAKSDRMAKPLNKPWSQ